MPEMNAGTRGAGAWVNVSRVWAKRHYRPEDLGPPCAVCGQRTVRALVLAQARTDWAPGLPTHPTCGAEAAQLRELDRVARAARGLAECRDALSRPPHPVG